MLYIKTKMRGLKVINTEEHISYRYPVQYGSPALHSDTLEDGEHSEADVIEAGDTAVRSIPIISTH